MVQDIRRVFGAELDAAAVVERILRDVREEGDSAVRRYNREFDGVPADLPLEVTRDEIERACGEVDSAVWKALETAAERIDRFHRRQLEHSLRSFEDDGVGQLVRPINRVGIYVPGTVAVYPSTVLMMAIPARVAGVHEVIMATPAAEDGRVSKLKLAAAKIAGVDRVFRASGAQGVAALAYGTETIPAVQKICGPGNIFVTLAKQRLYGEVGIDGIFGPSETVIVADDDSDPDLVAADLLAGAEHDEIATALLITTSQLLAERVAERVSLQLEKLVRREVASSALSRRGGIAVVDHIEHAIALANEFAPEHLCLHLKNSADVLDLVANAGCIFAGGASAESIGDYTAGPSHVMPTGGTAAYASALGVHDFLKVTSVVRLRQEAVDAVGPPAATIARAEGLTAHAESIEARLTGSSE